MIVRSHRSAVRFAAVAGLLAGVALTSLGAEVVILKDGFVIQGNVRKEVTSINDKATGKTFPIVKTDGFDMIDEGPKVVIFSTHAKQLGEVSKEIKLRPEYKAFKRDFLGRKSSHPLPANAATKSSTEFNEKWNRTMEVRVPLGWDKIEQQITYMDPYFTYMVSPTHLWRTTYRTNELDPKKVRKLLASHPELIEKDGAPEASKRVAIARFLLEVGWLKLAKDEMEQLAVHFPNGVPKDAKEDYESLLKEIDRATAALVVKEAELALGAGRYGYAGDLIAAFPEKLADSKQIAEVTRLMAQHKTARERYQSGRRLLRNLLDEISGLAKTKPAVAVSGGLVASLAATKALPTPLSSLVEAGEIVYASVHPDSAHRIEFFITLAAQDENEKQQGRDPTKKPEELLATAVSGWAKGKNGATAETDLALRIWLARTTVLEYQATDDLNTRNEILARYQKIKPIPIDELAQVVALLPPAQPENLDRRTGEPIPAKNAVPAGIYKRSTSPLSSHPGGIPYLVKLPPEYHHGRAYPVLIVLTHPSVDAEEALGSLAHESDRNGYILLAPEWAGMFGQGWRWNGDDHSYVTAVLRDAVRHFCVDNDRVFLLGAADGANMAMDIGMSHPDLFAGVLAMGPIPRWINMFNHYWSNAQKLPFYCVTGEMSGDSAANLRRIFGEWMPRGYPGIMVVYKGRGIEWYASEVPVMFDWMSRKKRVGGTATLALGNAVRKPWTTMRESDNRFYWLGVDGIARARLIDNWKGGEFIPAEIQGDITGNNVISIRSRGITRFSIWLTQDLIDWSQEVKVNVNGGAALGFKKRKLEPDLKLLLEDYRDRGDRRMLILGRLELTAVP